MSSQSIYRNGTSSHPFYSSHPSTSPTDSGQLYGSARDMLPPTAGEFPLRTMEIDLNSSILNNSRTLPNPSASASVPAVWDGALFGSHPMENQYGSSNVPRSHQPAEPSARTSQQDPMVQWWTANDGPWIPKQIIDLSADERSNLRPSGNTRISQSYGNQFRSSSQVDGASFHYSVPSDSGYGTRRSVGNTSVFSGDVNERDQDSQSLLGPPTDYQPYPSYNDSLQVQSHEVRTSDAWSTPGSAVSPPASSNLTCSVCNKDVKTQSELKKHNLRHTKPFVCIVQGCKRVGGFSTSNDLERHTKCKHPSALPESVSTKRFRCLVPGCKSKEKSWPRLDNFRSHLKRVHHPQYLATEVDFERMIRRGEYMDTTSLDIQEDSPQVLQPEYPSGGKPASADGLSRQGQNWRNTEDLRTSHSSIPSIGSVLEIPFYKPSSREERSSLQEVQQQETVKPVEVFPPQVLTNRTSSLDSIISKPDIPIDPALTNSTSEAPKASDEGKADKHQELSASNATMIEVVKTVLAVVGKAQSDASQSQATERNVLPNGRTPNDANSVANAVALHIPDDRSGFSSSSLDLNGPEARRNAQALEVLKLITEMGYTIQKDPAHPAKMPEPEPAVVAPKNDKKFTCQVCKKFTGRPCELKKHMKRHSKPYGCTFANCPKTFGSKNDWKRHENSQHFHQETLRCDIVMEEGASACGKAFYRRQTFQDHLKNHHHVEEEAAIKKKLESCRIGRNCQARFWCGFCQDTVELKKKGLDAWAERFDHIDDHFMGRVDGNQRNISDWVYVNSDKPRGDIDSPVASGLDKDGSETGASSPEAMGRTPADAIVLDAVVKGQSLKRKRGSDDEGKDARAPKVRSSDVRVCCQCGSYHNAKINDQCNTCEVTHPFCSACEFQPATESINLSTPRVESRDEQ